MKQALGKLAVYEEGIIASGVDPDSDPLDWEEWDPYDVPFWKHALAGSMAGIMEHVAIYPVDTVKTRMQAAPTSLTSIRLGALDTASHIIKTDGMSGLFRGCMAISVGCIPAHIGLFGTYELTKAALLSKNKHEPLRAAFCGAAATIVHDSIIVPLDVVKQRMQLGYYSSVSDCIRRVTQTEGTFAFFRSLPSTLLMECPFYAVLVASNESLKIKMKISHDVEKTGVGWHFLTAGMSGVLASMVTQPLDCVKTRLQTQELLKYNGNMGKRELGLCKYLGLTDTVVTMLREEGISAFWRGTLPRMVFAAPSAAMCWGTYEAVKSALASM